MNDMVCVSVSVFRDALTRGRRYTVLAMDGEKRQLRLKGDNGRTCWFPAGCFDELSVAVPTLSSYSIDGPMPLVQEPMVEVTVQLSDGEHRWCVFATPQALAQAGDWVEGTEVRCHYGCRHFIIANVLSEDIIAAILHTIDSQGQLVACTLPLESSIESNAMSSRAAGVISESQLLEIEDRISKTSPGPWKSYIEGRDHESGSDFIMTGTGGARGEDIEMLGATTADRDFIAAARQDVPALIAEIRRLRALLPPESQAAPDGKG